MRKWTNVDKRKLIVTLIAVAVAGVLGYVETLIPPIWPALPFLRVQLGIMFAAFVLLCYSPAEATLVWGVRCIVFGLVCDDGYAILFELLAGVLAFLAFWALTRTAKFGTISLGALMGLVYGLVYTCFMCIVPRSAAPFSLVAQTLLFYMVDYLVCTALAYIAFRYIPDRLLFDHQ